MASTSGGTLELSSVHSAWAAARMASLSAFALAIDSLRAVTAEVTDGAAVSTSLYRLLPNPRLSVATDSSRPLSSSGAYFSASARTSAMEDSIWAMVFSAGSFRFSQAVSARAVAASATKIFAIRIGVSSISSGSGNPQPLAGFDLVRVLQDIRVCFENLRIEHLVAVELLGDLRERVALLHHVILRVGIFGGHAGYLDAASSSQARRVWTAGVGPSVRRRRRARAIRRNRSASAPKGGLQ